jgi:hypothetical protein
MPGNHFYNRRAMPASNKRDTHFCSGVNIPVSTIFPHGCTAIPRHTSMDVPKAMVYLPSPSNVVSSTPVDVSRATAKSLLFAELYPPKTIFPSGWSSCVSNRHDTSSRSKNVGFYWNRSGPRVSTPCGWFVRCLSSRYGRCYAIT